MVVLNLKQHTYINQKDLYRLQRVTASGNRDTCTLKRSLLFSYYEKDRCSSTLKRYNIIVRKGSTAVHLPGRTMLYGVHLQSVEDRIAGRPGRLHDMSVCFDNKDGVRLLAPVDPVQRVNVGARVLVGSGASPFS